MYVVFQNTLTPDECRSNNISTVPSTICASEKRTDHNAKGSRPNDSIYDIHDKDGGMYLARFRSDFA